jgi:predicted HicB family RNase H-like nuclease
MLIYRGFIGQIDYDDETKKLVGEVVNSIDLLEFCGETAAEIKANFQDCIDEYMIFQNEYVGDNPIPFIGNFTISLTTDKQNKVIQAAQRNGQSVSHWLNRQVDSHLSQYFERSA